MRRWGPVARHLIGPAGGRSPARRPADPDLDLDGAGEDEPETPVTGWYRDVLRVEWPEPGGACDLPDGVPAAEVARWRRQ